ncbi:MAG: RDD family protein [Wenzhouxiangella sp.]|nr:RDD family protein [Wenzhouxiangella sp.]
MEFCALPRRIAIVIYDSLLIVALWMAAAAIVVAVRQSEIEAASLGFQLYLLTVAWLYLAICWRAGQTLGMKAWRVRMIGDSQGDSQAVSWPSTLVRFVVAILSWVPFGLGFVWSVFHPQRATWHDLASRTRLVLIPRPASKPTQ